MSTPAFSSFRTSVASHVAFRSLHSQKAGDPA